MNTSDMLPEKIYFPVDGGSSSYSDERVDKTDILYLRADVVKQNISKIITEIKAAYELSKD